MRTRRAFVTVPTRSSWRRTRRAAESAFIDSAQEGRASKRDMRAIRDLVGGKIRDIFGAQGGLLAGVVVKPIRVEAPVAAWMQTMPRDEATP